MADGSESDGFEWLGERPLAAAPRLLGNVLEVGARSGRIVEVEAYEGVDDLASHAAGGRTARNAAMFGRAGLLYVYRSYGVHWCANIVCGTEDRPGAVLIRALEPLTGLDEMWADRPRARTVTDLCSGPGKLCAALGIGGHHDGTDLLSAESPVRLLVAESGGPVGPVVRGPRVGITKAADRPWRFALEGNPHVSRPRPPWS